MQIDPRNIVLYRSIYTGEQIDTLLGLVRPASDAVGGLTNRVLNIERQLEPQVVLTIQQAQYRGGVHIESPAGGKCIAVENLPRGYKCTFDTNEGSDPVLFQVDDQAWGQRYDIGTTQANRYWRLVTEVGEDYIILSKTDCDPGSGAPAVGDSIITLGNRTVASRQSAKLSTTIGEYAPRDEYYTGISSYNLDNKLVTVIGVKDGKVGIWTENGYFSGEIHITGGSGLNELDEWEAVADELHAAFSTASEAQLAAEKLQLRLSQIDSDTVLDITEKKVIRTEWITINGCEDLDKGSEKGSYYRTRRLFSQYAYSGKPYAFLYNGVSYMFNGMAPTYRSIGLATLDTAYLALREYLYKVGLNERMQVFEDFDRQEMADLFTIYYDAELAMNEAVDEAIRTSIDDAKAEVMAELINYQEVMEDQLRELQDIVDGTIETWFMDGAPSLVSEPASDWTTDEEKERHLGDLYYDNLTGYAYRFQNNGEKYFWKYIEDSALAKALAAAAKAQDTADGKRRTFLSQPTAADAYDPGDMWLHATAGDYRNETLYCLTGKVAGASFSIAHWGLASKYTDDTVANAAAQAAANAAQAAANAQNVAAAAQTAADNAAQAAANANARLNSWADDGAISPTEKEALRQQQRDIVAEQADILAQATAYEVDATAYSAAYAAAVAALTKYTATNPENITIESDYQDIAAYYTARSTILQAIATAAKSVADEAQAAADAAQATADEASEKADEAQEAAEAAAQAATNAQNAAAAAQTAANDAAQAAANANARLNSWADDGTISPTEKEALRQQQRDIVAERADILAQATAYEVDATAYSAAYAAAVTALTKYTATDPENITIGSDYQDIAAYYTARSTILQAIATAAKSVADEAATIARDATQIAMKVAEAISRIDDDNILDLSEKREIQTTWVGVNGVLSTEYQGTSGTYAAAKEALAAAAGASLPVSYMFNGIVYTYGGYAFTYNALGASRLDVAYKSLREYLVEIQLNTDEYFEGFSRSRYANLLRDYNVALNNVNKVLSDIANANAKAALSGIDTAKNALARDLGYTDFADMEAAAQRSETIIVGGHIRTTLIDTETLLAKHVLCVDTYDVQSAYITTKRTVTDTMHISAGLLRLTRDYKDGDDDIELYIGGTLQNEKSETFFSIVGDFSRLGFHPIFLKNTGSGLGYGRSYFLRCGIGIVDDDIVLYGDNVGTSDTDLQPTKNSRLVAHGNNGSTVISGSQITISSGGSYGHSTGFLKIDASSAVAALYSDYLVVAKTSNQTRLYYDHLQIGTYNSNYPSDVALVINGSKATAVRLETGLFEGFRPKALAITSRYTLTNLDTTIKVPNSSAITVNLPSSPLPGQVYMIMHTTSTDLTISGNGKTIQRMVYSGTTTVNSLTSQSVEVMLFAYVGTSWVMTFIVRQA